MRPGFIAIEGVIGAGKTTLAKKLAASLGGEVRIYNRAGGGLVAEVTLP